MSIKRVFERMADSNPNKVELSKEEINLALVDDLGKALSSAKTIIGELNSTGSDAEKSLDEVNNLEKQLDKSKKTFFKHQKSLEKNMDKADKLENKIEGLFDKVDNAAKTLGISPKQIGVYSDLVNVSKDFSKAFSKYNRLTIYSDK